VSGGGGISNSCSHKQHLTTNKTFDSPFLPCIGTVESPFLSHIHQIQVYVTPRRHRNFQIPVCAQESKIPVCAGHTQEFSNSEKLCVRSNRTRCLWTIPERMISHTHATSRDEYSKFESLRTHYFGVLRALRGHEIPQINFPQLIDA